LRKTLRAGLRPELVFFAARQDESIVVAIDTHHEMRPWEAKIDEFLTGLERRAVRLERWSFDADLRELRGPLEQGPMPLESLAVKRRDRARHHQYRAGRGIGVVRDGPIPGSAAWNGGRAACGFTRSIKPLYWRPNLPTFRCGRTR